MSIVVVQLNTKEKRQERIIQDRFLHKFVLALPDTVRATMLL